jgi:hypothetical protein
MADEPLFFEHRAKNGQVMEFDISRSACEKFGFYYSDRVETPLGNASVVGVNNGCLWFLIDGDPGASFWDNGKCYEDLLKLGINLISDKPPPEDKKGYKVKTISYKGKNIPIVLQNENGPCPLIGISNVLALRGTFVIDGEGTNKNVVTLETLIDKLSAYLYAQHMDKGEEGMKMVQKAVDIMPQLQFGLDVNFNFKECDNFEKTDQCKLFELFDIRLVHGWLFDPEDLEMKNALGDNTYNDLMNKLVALDAPPTAGSSSQPTSQSDPQASQAPQTPLQGAQTPVAQSDPSSSGSQKKPSEEPPKPLTEDDFRQGVIINSFLNSTQSQLTSTGLDVLHRSIKEGELCVFFRNNHFSTLTKNDGKLYILVTDIGYERERNIVWDLLSTVDGSSIFCTSDFKCTDDVNREEIVNTLEAYGFDKKHIDECLAHIPSEDLCNTENAIQRALTMLQKMQGAGGEGQIQVL